MVKNYYEILGIHPRASSEDIRGAYRKRVKKLHPDHFGANSSPFLEVQEAYDVLSHPENRRKYDISLRLRADSLADGRRTIENLKVHRQRAEPLRDIVDPFDSGESVFRLSSRRRKPIIEDLFENRNVQSRSGYFFGHNPVYEVGLKINLSPDEARRGGRFRTFIPVEIPCPTCLAYDRTSPFECYRCMGTGSVSDNLPVAIEYAPGIVDGYRKNITLRYPGVSEVSLVLIFQIEGA